MIESPIIYGFQKQRLNVIRFGKHLFGNNLIFGKQLYTISERVRYVVDALNQTYC